MDGFLRLEEEVWELNSEKEIIYVIMKENKVSANEKAGEVINKGVSILALHNAVIKLDCKNIEEQGIVQSLELLNKELLKNMRDRYKILGKYVEGMKS